MNIIRKLKNGYYLDFSIVVFLLVLNIIIKSIFLTKYNIDLDEPFTLFRSQQSLSDLFTIFKWENNPPLYYVILHFWIKAFGVSAISARFLPMLFSSFSVIYIYKIGREFINIKIAIVASILYTFSNIIIMEAHEGRVYSLFVFLTVVSMYNFFSLIRSKKKTYYLVVLSICNVLLIYSHFLAFFVISLQSIYVLFIKSIRDKVFRVYLISILLLFFSYLPYVYFFILRLTNTFQVGINKPNLQFHDAYYYYLETFGNGSLAGNIFLIVIFLFGLSVLFKRLKTSIYERMLLGWFIILYLILILFSFKFQVLTTVKYIIFLIPGFCFTVTIAIDHLTKKNLVINYLSLSVSILLMVTSVNLNYSQGLESKRAVSYIAKQKKDSTLVLIAPTWIDVVFTYHYNIEAFKDYKNFQKYLNDNNIFIISSGNEINQTKLSEASDVLLLDGWYCMDVVDPQSTIINTLKSQFEVLDTTVNYLGYTIYHFKKDYRVIQSNQ